jgi:hypothetical protein
MTSPELCAPYSNTFVLVGSLGRAAVLANYCWVVVLPHAAYEDLDPRHEYEESSEASEGRLLAQTNSRSLCVVGGTGEDGMGDGED